ncbi:MAG: leucine-rich repeat domain-containing protein [Chloroflexota bacterium]
MPKDDAYQKAEQKIAETLQSRATELDLSTMKLTELPDSLGQLTQLTSLDLSNNQLTTLPDSLGQLTQLTELNLSRNQLISLPDSLGQLTQLQFVDLSNNLFTIFPYVLLQLKQLRELGIGKTGIQGPLLTTIPLWLRKAGWGDYEHENINQLTKLPDSIYVLTKLGLLDVSGNMLLDIPPSLAHLSI